MPVKTGAGAVEFDGGEDGPTAFAGIGDAAREAFERRLIEQGNGGQMSSHEATTLPRRHTSVTSARFEIVLIVFGIPQRGISASVLPGGGTCPRLRA